MKEQSLDALLMFRQESMYWLTGYDTFGYVFFQTLVLDNKGNVILLTRAPDLRQAQNTSNINDIRIWVDKDGSKPADDLKIILDELGLKGKKLGIEYEAYGLTGKNALALNKSLENYCSVEDKSNLINMLRVIKSNEEINYVKNAAELADKALDEVWKKTYPNVSYPVSQYIDSCLNIKRASIFCSFIICITFDFLLENSSFVKCSPINLTPSLDLNVFETK